MRELRRPVDARPVTQPGTCRSPVRVRGSYARCFVVRRVAERHVVFSGFHAGETRDDHVGLGEQAFQPWRNFCENGSKRKNSIQHQGESGVPVGTWGRVHEETLVNRSRRAWPPPGCPGGAISLRRLSRYT